MQLATSMHKSDALAGRSTRIPMQVMVVCVNLVSWSALHRFRTPLALVCAQSTLIRPCFGRWQPTSSYVGHGVKSRLVATFSDSWSMVVCELFLCSASDRTSELIFWRTLIQHRIGSSIIYYIQERTKWRLCKVLKQFAKRVLWSIGAYVHVEQECVAIADVANIIRFTATAYFQEQELKMLQSGHVFIYMYVSMYTYANAYKYMNGLAPAYLIDIEVFTGSFRVQPHLQWMICRFKRIKQ